MPLLSALFLLLISPEARSLPNQVGGVCWDSNSPGCKGAPSAKPSLSGGRGSSGGGGAPPSAAMQTMAEGVGGLLGTLLMTPTPKPSGTKFFGTPTAPEPPPEENAEEPAKEAKPAPPKDEKKAKPAVMGVTLTAAPTSAAPGKSVALSVQVIVIDAANTGRPFSKAGFKVVFRSWPGGALTFDPATAVTDDAGSAAARATVPDGCPRRVTVSASVDGYSDSRQLVNPQAVPRPADLPAPASDAQLDATIAELHPFLAYDRTDKDAADPVWDYSVCESGCGCPDAPVKVGTDADGRAVRKVLSASCTDDCSGTCYQLGGKSLAPGGTGSFYGVDCSGLIRQENPEFWKKADRYWKKVCPGGAASCDPGEKDLCPDLGPGNDCTRMTQQQLQLLISEHRDDIDYPGDLRAGDAAYFEKGGAVDHVVQVASDPACGAHGCTLMIIEAPRSGLAVRQREITLDPDGCLKGSTLCFYKGGTPPPGPKTGAKSP